MITISSLFGKTITIGQDGVSNVEDALAHYYGNDPTPDDIKVTLGGQDVSDFSTAVRDGDVLIVRTGQMASKPQLSGA